MLQVLTYLFCLVHIWHLSNGLDDLPPYLPRCKRTDPNLEKCLLDATEKVRPYVKAGIPDFLPSAANLLIPQIVMEQGNRAVNVKAELNNVTAVGLENYRFTRYQYDVANTSFYIEVLMPELYLYGQYKLEGTVFFAKIKGEGIFDVNITDTNCSIIHPVEIVERKGVKYIHPLSTTTRIEVGKVANYNFEGLFRDNKELAKMAHNIIRENLDVIIEEITPATEKVLSALFDNYIFSTVVKIPYDKLYPE